MAGYRLTTPTSGSIVDAAHIHQFSDSRNNDVGNGIGLSKNALWSFDQGLWAISDKFTESADAPDLLLAPYHGAPLRVPADHALWPSLPHLAWHRKNKLSGQ